METDAAAGPDVASGAEAALRGQRQQRARDGVKKKGIKTEDKDSREHWME